MTQPFLIIGCGGSGGKVVLGLRRKLELELSRQGWAGGLPRAWQLKWIDVPDPSEDHPDFGDPLPLGDYLPLARVNAYEMYDSALTQGVGATKMDRLVGWRPSPHLNLPVKKGAGQMRAVGRVVSLNRVDEIRRVFEDALSEMQSGATELAQLMNHLEGKVVGKTPVVIIVSSMAGGTGAGIFLDVCDIARGMSTELSNQIFGVLFTAEIFSGISSDAGMVPNTVASLSELMSGNLAANRALESLYGAVGGVAVQGRSGPNYPFVIGMRTMESETPLESPEQCYRAVTETIAASMLNSKFSQDFLNYQIANFIPNAGPSRRNTAYQMLNLPRVDIDPAPCGLVSSFGSAQVAVGTALFGTWAQARLTRSVIDHITIGWQEYGRKLMGKDAGPSTTQDDVVRFLVEFESVDFIKRCGLFEEDDADGTRNDQVVDGILPTEAMERLSGNYLSKIRDEIAKKLGKGGARLGAEWPDEIYSAGEMFEQSFKEEVERELIEGYERYASQLSARISSAVSTAIAESGVPVAKGLIQELSRQCKVAAKQLRDQELASKDKYGKSIIMFLKKRFEDLGRSKVTATNKTVDEGINVAVRSRKHYVVMRRCEKGAALLDDVEQRVISPLAIALDELGAKLGDPKFRDEVMLWPDESGDVPSAYRPAPTEKVLLNPSEWDSTYRGLLAEVAGSVEAARDEIAAGGFGYGPAIDRKQAESMLVIDHKERWWDQKASPVKVTLNLQPGQVRKRASQWLTNENTSVGRFLGMGLKEYLDEPGAERPARMKAFEEAFTAAFSLAQPLISIPESLMSRVHPTHSSRACNFICEPVPFPPSMTEGRAIVEKVLYGHNPPPGGWFKASNVAGVEKILMTSVLENAVQPAAVMSLSEPVYRAWDKVVSQPAHTRTAAIQGFWSNNRARLLSEAIPLTVSAQRSIVRGWFVGRLLGLVTDPTETEPCRVCFREDGADFAAKLPWPLLHHGKTGDLHKRTHTTKLLPALLEHMALSMLTLGHKPDALDGYEMLYRLGNNMGEVVADWVLDGSLPVSNGQKPQVEGHDAESRRDALQSAVTTLSERYETAIQKEIYPSSWSKFVDIPFGIELYPLFAECLAEIGAAAVVDIEDSFG